MTPLLVANWKMHKTTAEALVFLQEARGLWPKALACEAAIAPQMSVLGAVAPLLKGTPFALAAQNVHWEAEGAFTGETSARSLAEQGCRYVIVGHSERRSQGGETDEQINGKVKAVLAHGMTPILCVGETLRQRDAGRILETVGGQFTEGLRDVAPLLARVERERAPLAIAYEPVWAIGTGRVAEPAQVREVHAALRQWLRDRMGAAADRTLLLYGGSVTPENVDEMVGQPDVNGALVGGASLDAKQFVRVAERTAKAKAEAVS